MSVQLPYIDNRQISSYNSFRQQETPKSKLSRELYYLNEPPSRSSRQNVQDLNNSFSFNSGYKNFYDSGSGYRTPGFVDFYGPNYSGHIRNRTNVSNSVDLSSGKIFPNVGQSVIYPFNPYATNDNTNKELEKTLAEQSKILSDILYKMDKEEKYRNEHHSTMMIKKIVHDEVKKAISELDRANFFQKRTEEDQNHRKNQDTEIRKSEKPEKLEKNKQDQLDFLLKKLVIKKLTEPAKKEVIHANRRYKIKIPEDSDTQKPMKQNIETQTLEIPPIEYKKIGIPKNETFEPKPPSIRNDSLIENSPPKRRRFSPKRTFIEEGFKAETSEKEKTSTEKIFQSKKFSEKITLQKDSNEKLLSDSNKIPLPSIPKKEIYLEFSEDLELKDE